MTASTAKFEAEIATVIRRTLTETKYRPTYFMQMVTDQGAYNASLQLIRSKSTSAGFTSLWELQRLDLTVEAVALRPEFADLFTADDLAAAKKRLKEYNYTIEGTA